MGFRIILFNIFYIISILEFLKPYFEFYLGSKIPFIFLYIGLIIIAITLKCTQSDFRIKFYSIDIVIFILYFIGFLYLIFSNDFTIALSGFKNNFIFIYIYFFIRVIKPNTQAIYNYLKFFTFFFLLIGIYGIYQYFFDYYTIALKFNFTQGTHESYFGLSENEYEVYNIKRAYGLFKYWTAFGYSTMMGAVFSLCLMLDIKNNKKIYNLYLVIFIFAMILSMSRTSYIAFLIGAIVGYRLNKKIPVKVILYGLIFIVPLFFINHDFSDTILSRITTTFSLDPSKSSSHSDFLFNNIYKFFDAPFGIGLGATENQEEWVESAFFKYSREIGIIPAFLVLYMFYSSLKTGIQLLKLKKYESKDKVIIIYAIAIITGFFVAGINFPLWFSWFPEGIMWLLMAVIINYKEKFRNHNKLSTNE